MSSEEVNGEEDSSRPNDSYVGARHVGRVQFAPGLDTLPTHQPLETHMPHDRGTHKGEDSFGSCRLPPPPPPKQVLESHLPLEVKNIEEEYNRMHVDRLRITAGNSPEGDNRQQDPELISEESTAQDERHAAVLYGHTSRDLLVQGDVLPDSPQRLPRKLPTVKARQPTHPLAIIAKATPL